MKRRLLPFFLLIAGLGATGCATAGTAYVRIAPPPVRVERFGPAPGPGYVRVDGYWRWGGRDYVWVPGSWARPPRHRSAWVPGHWAPSPRGYVWRAGHWR